jgi:predicted GNAT superfamily acetyltransferase
MESALTIRPAREARDFQACVDLQRVVWGLSDLEITSAIQLVATTHAGGLLLVAEDGAGELVGFSYAFAALTGGEGHLHSDMLAVRPELRGRGLGARLKWAQREEALRRGVRLVTWTFDPMQARNARLNLRRLGALATEVRRDFYGATTSALHHGLPTDRLLVRWELESPRVRRRVAGPPPPPQADAVAWPRVGSVSFAGDRPALGEPCLDLDDPVVLLEIPADWNALCRSHPHEAAACQRAITHALEAYLARGYRAVDLISGEGPPRAFYALARRETEAG